MPVILSLAFGTGVAFLITIGYFGTILITLGIEVFVKRNNLVAEILDWPSIAAGVCRA
jgi:hypothetical protein